MEFVEEVIEHCKFNETEQKFIDELVKRSFTQATGKENLFEKCFEDKGITIQVKFLENKISINDTSFKMTTITVSTTEENMDLLFSIEDFYEKKLKSRKRQVKEAA